jgi:hypothetical protein
MGLSGSLCSIGYFMHSCFILDPIHATKVTEPLSTDNKSENSKNLRRGKIMSRIRSVTFFTLSCQFCQYLPEHADQ